MPEKTAYLPGEPIWVDLASADPAASAAFYGALLGWTATEPQAEFGGYASFLRDGRMVAGLVPLMAAGQPTTWTCYLASDDADKTAELVEQAGGSTLVAPMTVADLGRMSVHVDPSGGVIGVWQAGQHTGAQLVDEEGTTAWVELSTADPAATAPFYRSVFGWGTNVSDSYVEFTLEGRSVAGCTDLSQGTSGWVPYFAVADPAATTEQAEALGATVVLPLTHFDGGSCTIVRDPHGAVFGLLHASA
jgi:predicted enzyme related to lactoylglutathione lyase